MSTLAEELAGGASTVATRRPGITTRVHRLGADAEDNAASTPTQQREAILAALREEQPRDREYFREALGIDGADLELALTKLRDKGLIYGIQGEGYRLGRRPMPAVPGTPVLQPSKETTMPKGHYDRSKAKRAADDEAAGDVKPGARKKAKRRVAAARTTKPRVTERGAQFIVDDLGSVSIVDGDQRIELSATESTRLHSFLERTKAFRA